VIEKENAVIPVGFVSDALEIVRAHGLSPDDILLAAQLQNVFAEAAADGRISVKQFARLWRTVSAAIGDEAFGLGSHAMRPGSFDMMCASAIHCESLRKAVKRALQFLNLVLDDPKATLVTEGKTSRIVLEDRRQSGPAFACWSYWVMLHGMMCWFVGRNIPLLQVDMTASTPTGGSAFRVFFGAPVRFQQPAGQIVFDTRVLKLPIVRTERNLGPFLRRAPQNLLEGHYSDQDTTDTVRHALRNIAPSEWPNFDTICSSLSLAPRTVRGRMHSEGQTFQGLKNEIRREMAIQFLLSSDLSIVEIATALGYREPSALYKSFHTWMACSPGEYRQRLRILS
jgi:AraC-like DNA-binding protein